MTWRVAESEMTVRIDGGALHPMVVCQQTHPLSHARSADMGHRPPQPGTPATASPPAAQRLFWAQMMASGVRDTSLVTAITDVRRQFRRMITCFR